jgi:hypothetical protein
MQAAPGAGQRSVPHSVCFRRHQLGPGHEAGKAEPQQGPEPRDLQGEPL